MALPPTNFLAQSTERGLHQLQLRQFRAAVPAVPDVELGLAACGGRYFTERISLNIDCLATHIIYLTPTGVSAVFNKSSAVYKRDFTVDTGISKISAISSNLKPW